jgi:hypothetical protein
MIKRLLHVVACLACAVTVHAQIASVSNTSILPSNETFVNKISSNNTDPVAAPGETPDEARKQLMRIYNLYKEYSVSVDSLSLYFDLKAVEQLMNEPLDKSKADEFKTFGDFISNTDKMLNKKIEKMALDTISNFTQLPEKSRLLRGLTILNSAKCLEGKQEGRFLRTKDLDGYDILSFNVDSLRKNPRYGSVDNYREGFSRIKKDQVYGYLNYCGDEFITCQYERADNFNNGKALVKKVNWYFIDGLGNEGNTLENVVDARALAYGYSLVKLANGKQAIIDNTYDETLKPISQLYDAIEPFVGKDLFKVRDGEKFGIIRIDGAVKRDVIYTRIDRSNASNLYVIEQDKKLGIMDNQGTVIVKPVLLSISFFNDFGLALAKDEFGSRYFSRRTYKMSESYAELNSFNSLGLATVRNDSKFYGIIDTGLNIVVKPNLYSGIGDFNTFGLCEVTRDGLLHGFIDPKGKEIIPSKYTKVSTFNRYRMAAVEEEIRNCGNGAESCKVWKVIDTNNNTIVPMAEGDFKGKVRYEVTDTLLGDRHVAVVAYGYRGGAPSFHIVSRNGLVLVNKKAYSIINPFDANGLSRVQTSDDKWGFIDTTGREVCKPIFGEIKRQSEGYYAVKNAETNDWGFVDKKGKPQINYEYDDIKQTFRAGYAIVSKGKNKVGLINKFNAKVVPLQFKSINYNDNHKYEVTDIDGTIYILNEKGDCETNCPKFEEIRKNANSK